ncbi:recombinase family protein [Anaeromicropila populeti]|uniref:Site-specific DNA recombinase n=1 Tax=Anaeromicropila populeti TaxID=37658 RepID=A0A1I6KMG1_9FIRM|nr:recombinase family protein [Anaeromicropila populeti]SFR92208.1 Site-specific DNA recombinase [Anaeromicropila populeti]
MIYCIYLRKSRADQDAEIRGEGETLARHETALLTLAESLNLPIGKIYKEIVSGETIAARPVMQQLLHEVEQNIWSGVLVMEVERLARGNTLDQGIVAQAFQISGTKIITPLKTFDPLNEFDEEYFEFGLYMSRREYKTINRRIQRGRIASAKEGRYIASVPPFGYDKVKIDQAKGYTLLPNENAPIVQLIFNLYTKGTLTDGISTPLGSNQIAHYLDRLGVKPPLSKQWSTASIRDILKNPVYIGKIRWQYRKEHRQILQGTITKIRQKSDDYILVNGLHKAIINDQTYDKAQARLKRNTKACVKANLTLKNPFSGILYCKKCGSPMIRLGPNKRNSYSSVKCPNPRCDNISSPIFLVEQKVILALQYWLEGYRLTLQETSASNTVLSLANVIDTSIEKLDCEIFTLQKQQQNTYSLLEQGIYTADLFLERQVKLKNEIKVLKDKKAVLLLEKDKTDSVLDAKTNFNPETLSIIDIYNTLEGAAEKNALLKLLLVRIEYVKTQRNKKGQLENPNFEIELYPAIPHKL